MSYRRVCVQTLVVATWWCCAVVVCEVRSNHPVEQPGRRRHHQLKKSVLSQLTTLLKYYRKQVYFITKPSFCENGNSSFRVDNDSSRRGCAGDLSLLLTKNLVKLMPLNRCHGIWPVSPETAAKTTLSD